jgi:Tetratricopeptide repeat
MQREGYRSLLAGSLLVLATAAWAQQEPAALAAADHMQLLDPSLRALATGEAGHKTIQDLIRQYEGQGRYSEVEPLLKFNIGEIGREHGSNHFQTAMRIVELAYLYRRFDYERLPESELHHKQSLEMLERTYGKDDVGKTQWVASLLAEYYRDQKRFGAAARIYQGIVESRDRALGKTHPKTLEALAQLGGIYVKQGRYDEARVLRDRLREARRDLGDKVWATLYLRTDDLAGVDETSRNMAESEERKKRHVAESQEKYGKDHHIAMEGVRFQLLHYTDTGRYEKAEALNVEALQFRESVLDTEDEDTITAMKSLVKTYLLQDKYAEAHRLLDRYRADYQRNLGKEHPLAVWVLMTSADVHFQEQRLAEAEQGYKRAVEARTHLYGPGHKDTIEAVGKLAALYRAQGRYAEAAPLFEAVLAATERRLGKDDRHVVRHRSDLVGTYRLAGRHEEANALSTAR